MVIGISRTRKYISKLGWLEDGVEVIIKIDLSLIKRDKLNNVDNVKRTGGIKIEKLRQQHYKKK